MHSVAERLINLSSDESEDSDEEVCQQDTSRNLVDECKAMCFETELRQLAAMKPITTCKKEDCLALTAVSVKYIGTSVQFKWVSFYAFELEIREHLDFDLSVSVFVCL